MSDNIPTAAAVAAVSGPDNAGSSAPSPGVQNIATQITAADVKANRLKNVLIPKEKQRELKNLMKLKLPGCLTPQEYEAFLAYKTKAFDQLLQVESLVEATDLHDRLRELMEYAVQLDSSGDLIFLNLYVHYCKNRTDEQLVDAFFYAWIQSVFFGIYFALDDMVDKASVRRFELPYYLDVGSELATMRILVLFNAILEALMAKFQHQPFGFKLVQRFAYYSTLGTRAQLQDAQGQNKKEKMWDLEFRKEHNNAVCAPLTHLPLEVAALMTGCDISSVDTEVWKSMISDVTMLTRNMNDFTDVYPKNPTGKPLYIDIAVGASTWCSGTAWKLASAEQKVILQLNYGENDDKKIAKVLQVFQDLNLQQKYIKDKKELLMSIWSQFVKCPDQLAPKDAFMEIVKFMAADHQLSWM